MPNMCLPWPQPDPRVPVLPTCWVSKKLIHSPPSHLNGGIMQSPPLRSDSLSVFSVPGTFDTLTPDYCYRGDGETKIEHVLFSQICKIHPEIPMVIVNNIPELIQDPSAAIYTWNIALINWQNMGFPINFLSARLSTRACSTRGKYYNLSVEKIWKCVTWAAAAALPVHFITSR